jgi:large subunit ribosomal protein L22
MPEFGYSYNRYNATTQVRARLSEVDISPKGAREVALAIKGMSLAQARDFLKAVIEKRRPVAFRRYHKEGAHRRGLEGFHSGRYPVKVAKNFLELLDNLEANATYKGLDLDRLRLIHVAAYPGRKLKRYQPRAFGRSSPAFKTLTHVEAVAEEVS